MDPILDLLSDLYSELNTISIDASGPSSCPTLYNLPTTFYLPPKEKSI